MIYRIDVTAKGHDLEGDSIRQQIAGFGISVGETRTARVFLIESDEKQEAIARIANELLADPVNETAAVYSSDQRPAHSNAQQSLIEVHLKPGVMDPVATSTEMAISDMGLKVRQVRTGRAYRITGAVPKDQLQLIASRVLANGVIESVHFDFYHPTDFSHGHETAFKVRHVDLLKLNDEQLKKLSREGHLFLSLAEMKAVQDYFKKQNREPTDIELETIAQTWSEHCVHKTLKSAVSVCDESGNELRKYGNLIKETIFDSTMKLMGDRDPKAKHGLEAHATKEVFCLSVFKDNAGVVVFDETDAVCFKVETHNHPSAIEPYGGSATGAGGCIRDVMGTGLSAKPIANTDIFCVAFPDGQRDQETTRRKDKVTDGKDTLSLRDSVSASLALPKGVIHPKRVLQQVVAGVRDYGNRMGIPTINGAVYFDDRYLGNPLVFCGCVGIIPRDKIFKQSQPGDSIVVMGGRTGRDGIHGATFSSAELTDTHADEFSHAVQIGNAITQKKMMDVILQARDKNLFTAITDCGAGGLSSAVGEMGEKLGAAVELDKVPLKYAGLRYDEIWISEAQERMVMSVPGAKVDEILKLAQSEDVEATVIGTFGTPDRELILNYRNTEVGRLSMEFLHDGIPMGIRKAVVNERRRDEEAKRESEKSGTWSLRGSVSSSLLQLLSHPNIASKHWIIRQYDHEVQGGSVIKPLTGPMQIGPSDASVIRPKLSGTKGVVLSCGLQPAVSDPYEMALAAVDEAIRNAVCVGADLDKLAILDNFCWPSVDDEKTMGTLVRACEGCRDAALGYGVPFISGKDSLHNQFTIQETGQVLRIPNTLLISAMGVLDDVRNCQTMDLKKAGSTLLLIGASQSEIASRATLHRAVSRLVRDGTLLAIHDVSDGGILVAAAEMCIASGIGLDLNLPAEAGDAFSESPARYLVEIADENLKSVQSAISNSNGVCINLGTTQQSPKLVVSGHSQAKIEVSIDEMTRAWRGTLDW